jgi:hypothetical protein
VIRYNIVLKNNENFVLASCKTLEFAKNYLKEIKKTDQILKKYYNWSSVPKYKIIESRED